MCEQRESASRNARQRRTELPLGNHSEAIDAGIDEEALESGHARGRQCFDVFLIIADDAAPGSPVYPALAASGFSLRFERGNRGRGRQTIQRHIREQRVASGGSSASRVCESFPVRTSGLVNVNMRIDQPWKDYRLPKIMDLGMRGQLIRGRYGLDSSLLHK
jgi:hypothetical protein